MADAKKNTGSNPLFYLLLAAGLGITGYGVYTYVKNKSSGGGGGGGGGTSYPTVSITDIVTPTAIPNEGSLALSVDMQSSGAATIQLKVEILNGGVIIATQTKDVTLTSGKVTANYYFSSISGSGNCTVRVTVSFQGTVKGSRDWPNAFQIAEPPTIVNVSASLVVDSSPISNPTGWIIYYMDSLGNLHLPDEGAAQYFPLDSTFHFSNVSPHGFITIALVNATTGTELQWEEVFFMNSNNPIAIHLNGEVFGIVRV